MYRVYKVADVENIGILVQYYILNVFICFVRLLSRKAFCVILQNFYLCIRTKEQIF